MGPSWQKKTLSQLICLCLGVCCMSPPLPVHLSRLQDTLWGQMCPRAKSQQRQQCGAEVWRGGTAEEHLGQPGLGRGVCACVC